MKSNATIWSNNPISGHISGQNHNSKGYRLPSVHCSTIYNSQDMEATLMFINIAMDKEDVVHIYNIISLSHKTEWSNTICSNMNGPRDCHTEWSKSEREREIWYCLYVESKKGYKWAHLQNRDRVTGVKNQLKVTRDKEGRDKLEVGLTYTCYYI